MPAKPDPETTTIVIEGVRSSCAHVFYKAMEEAIETCKYENPAEWFNHEAIELACKILTEDGHRDKLLEYRTEQNLLKKIEAENEKSLDL